MKTCPRTCVPLGAHTCNSERAERAARHRRQTWSLLHGVELHKALRLQYRWIVVFDVVLDQLGLRRGSQHLATCSAACARNMLTDDAAHVIVTVVVPILLRDLVLNGFKFEPEAAVLRLATRPHLALVCPHATPRLPPNARCGARCHSMTLTGQEDGVSHATRRSFRSGRVA